jgi:hypothetical protein
MQAVGYSLATHRPERQETEAPKRDHSVGVLMDRLRSYGASCARLASGRR